jgi:hypothetical protein
MLRYFLNYIRMYGGIKEEFKEVAKGSTLCFSYKVLVSMINLGGFAFSELSLLNTLTSINE